MAQIKRTFSGKGEMDFVITMMVVFVVSIGGVVFH